MSVYLLIDATRTVVNAVVIDQLSDYTPPEGHTVEPRCGAEWIGWSKVDGVWVEPAAAE